MSRVRLPERHVSITSEVYWDAPGGSRQKFVVTYGLNKNQQVKEVFCASFKGSSDVVAFANDACILLSRLLQHGERISDLIGTLGEDRQEGQNKGPPASVLGAIVQRGIEIEGGGSEK